MSARASTCSSSARKTRRSRDRRRIPRRSGGRARAARRLPDARCADNPPPDLTRLYWLARVTLVSRLEDIPSFDAVFATHFAGAPPDIDSRADDERRDRGAGSPSATASCSRSSSPRAPARARASTSCATGAPTTRRTEDLPSCARRSREHLPRVRSRRRARTGAARIDLRRTLRAATRTGEITTLARRERPHRPRPLLILIDVSGSLRPHTPDYLRFAWAAQAETFTFGTRLTRVTEAAARRATSTPRWRTSPSTSLDADGGTRIGAALQEFLATPRYADRARGALTIVLSDGLERGDPAPMAQRGPPPRAALAPAAVVDAARRSTPPTARSRARWPRSRTTSTASPAPATSRPCSNRCQQL